jgi:AcrR family transcriptional regulator
MTAPSLRARVREELTTAIKAAARRRLATEGANLSLRAIAREMGMVSSAVYRYFPSRDDLLTALIIDCYNEMGEAAEQAADPALPLPQRFLAFGHALRDWALAHPAEYALLYGSPVPGYSAPQDTVGPAARTTMVFLGFLSEVDASGATDGMPPSVDAELARFTEDNSLDLSPAMLARGATAWVQLFGLITFEIFGRLNGLLGESRRDFYDHQLRVMATFVGLQDTGS